MLSLYHFSSLLAAILILICSTLTLMIYFTSKKSSLLYSFLFILPFGISPFRYQASIPYIDIQSFFDSPVKDNLFLFSLSSILIVYSSLKLLDLFQVRFISLVLGVLVFSSILLKILSITEIWQVPNTVFDILKFTVMTILFILFLSSIKKYWTPESKVLGIGFITMNGFFLVIFLLNLLFGDPIQAAGSKWLPILDSLYGIILSLIFTIYVVLHFFIHQEEKRGHLEIEKVFKDEYGITQREWEIICFTCNGYTSGDISRILNISQQTVKNHSNNIYRKLEIHSKIELVNLVQHPQEN